MLSAAAQRIAVAMAATDNPRELADLGRALSAVLRPFQRPAVIPGAPPGPPNSLQRMRAARAAQDTSQGWSS
jgi:hypothetical protein